ncbi:helix-turn-helix transcriptional regulator [Jannaschia sp. R86511]|uniref:helix-turn-helix transcriptional regulator n=1 Tax=Jannaschia sp. R86511 TaxID=3093853 RepID=UPI0036D32A20
MNLQLSLPDVARLAGVQRPVVSMWRRRYENAERPFPRPVARVSNRERFDADEVVGWLEATGRTHGRDMRADVAVHAMPIGLTLSSDPAALDGLTALIALKAATDTALDGLTVQQLTALAASVDPRDTHLLREVDGLGAKAASVAAYADELVDAAYSPRDALEGLLAERFRHDATDLIASSLTPGVHNLVVALVRGLGVLQGTENPSFLDPTGVGSDLLLSAVDAAGDVHPDVLVSASEHHAARLFRRRAAARGLLLTPAPAALDDAQTCLMLAHYPVVGSPQMTPLEILDAIDELVVSMADHHYAVVVAPAAVLVDRLRDRETRAVREHVLRAGRIRAAMRLPAGSVTQRPRESLAIWVLGEDPTDAVLGDRTVAVGHLPSPSLSRTAVTAIVDDVVASASTLAGAHHYTHLALVRTAALLASGGSLIPTRRAPGRMLRSPADLTLQVTALSTAKTFEAPLAGLRVEPGFESRAALTTTLAEAIEAGIVRAISGNRTGFDLVTNGSVPVLGVLELTGKAANGSRRVDRLSFLGAHSSSRLTEPGDVVFCTAPCPRAVVDTEGGSAVQYPARILRVDRDKGEGSSPWVIASTIASQPPEARDWRRWTVPVLPPTRVPPTSQALAAIEAQRRDLQRRLTDLDTLTDLVIAGVSSHALTLHPTDSPEHPQKEGI